jgi:hypothetical protein
MKYVHWILSVLVVVGLSGVALFITKKIASSAEAACRTCHMVIYPKGGPVISSCRRTSSQMSGPRHCVSTPTSCRTFGYGSCSG